MEQRGNNSRLAFILNITILVLVSININMVADAADEGTLKWALPINGKALVIGGDGTIYIAGGGLYALNPDGSQKWWLDICADKPSIGDDGTIYLTTCDGLTAVNPDGSVKWNYSITGEYGSIAIGDDGTIYLILNNKLHAFDPDGTQRWVCQETLSGVQKYGLAIGADGTIYVNSTDLFAINPDGSTKWRKHDDSVYSPNLAIGPGGTIYAAKDGSLEAINPDGSSKWLVSFYDAGAFSPVNEAVVDADGTIIVYGVRVLASQTPDGTILEGHYRDDTTYGDLIAIGADGVIYVEVALENGEPHLIAYNPKVEFQNGFMKWGLSLGEYGSLSFLTLSADGVLYATTECDSIDCEMYLLAVNVSSKGLAKSSWPIQGHDERQTSRVNMLSTKVLSADFNTGTQSFTYYDDEFHNTKHPDYASGGWTANGGFFSSGGLHVSVGNVDGKDIMNGMSGGWSKYFYLDREYNAAINLKYRLMTSRYDADECGEALVAIDDKLVMDLAKLCGRGLDTGWQPESFNQTLSEGTHKLTVGAYNNKKTGPREKTDAYFDDISITIAEVDSPETDCNNGLDDDGDGKVDCDDSDCLDSIHCDEPDGLSVNFDTGSDGFIFADDTFNNTYRPLYASGDWTATSGHSGSGGLHLALGNIDGTDILNGMSGGWIGNFNLKDALDVEISLKYRLVMTRFDPDECAKVLVQVDNGPIEMLEELCGRDKDTGWKTKKFNRSLSAGEHTITVGGFNNKKTGPREVADIYFDDIEIQ